MISRKGFTAKRCEQADGLVHVSELHGWGTHRFGRWWLAVRTRIRPSESSPTIVTGSGARRGIVQAFPAIFSLGRVYNGLCTLDKLVEACLFLMPLHAVVPTMKAISRPGPCC